jgi:hypothetical protein
MPPGSRPDLPAQPRARPHGCQLDRCFVACFHSLPEFERLTQPTPACRLVAPGACKRLAHIFPGFVFPGQSWA